MGWILDGPFYGVEGRKGAEASSGPWGLRPWGAPGLGPVSWLAVCSELVRILKGASSVIVSRGSLFHKHKGSSFHLPNQP